VIISLRVVRVEPSSTVNDLWEIGLVQSTINGPALKSNYMLIIMLTKEAVEHGSSFRLLIP